MNVENTLKEELNIKNINLKNTTNIFYNRNFGLLLIAIGVMSLSVLIPLYLLIDFPYLISSYLIPIIYSAIFFLLVLLGQWIMNLFYYKKYVAMQGKLSKIDWKKLYSLKNSNTNNNGFEIIDVVLNKFNITYYELKKMSENKTTQIVIENSISFKIKNSSIKLIYNSLEVDNEKDDIVLNLKIIFIKDNNNDLFSKMISGKLNISHYKENEFIELKVPLLNKYEISDNLTAFQRWNLSSCTKKIEKNNFEELTNNIIGQFYSIVHNRRNFLEKYTEKISFDINQIIHLFD